MVDRIRARRDTSTQWAAVNPILADGELAYAKDTKTLKIGNGVTRYNALPFFPASILPAGGKGDILYHNGTDWVVLTPGTPGYFLRTGGPSANPAWASGGGGGGISVVEVTGIGNDSNEFEDYKPGQTVLVTDGATGKFAGHTGQLATVVSRDLRPSPRRWSTPVIYADPSSELRSTNIVAWERVGVPGIDGDLISLAYKRSGGAIEAILLIHDREMVGLKTMFDLGDFSAYYTPPADCELNPQNLVIDGDLLYITVACQHPSAPTSNLVVVLRFILDVDSTGAYTFTQDPAWSFKAHVVDAATSRQPQLVDTQMVTRSGTKHLRVLSLNIGASLNSKLWMLQLTDGDEIGSVVYPDLLMYQPKYADESPDPCIYALKISFSGSPSLLFCSALKIKESDGTLIYEIPYMKAPAASTSGVIAGFIGFTGHEVIGDYHYLLGPDWENNIVPSLMRFQATGTGAGRYIDALPAVEPLQSSDDLLTQQDVLGVVPSRMIYDPVNQRMTLGGYAYVPGDIETLLDMSQVHMCLATWVVDTVNFSTLKIQILDQEGDYIFSGAQPQILNVPTGLGHTQRVFSMIQIRNYRQFPAGELQSSKPALVGIKNWTDFEATWDFTPLPAMGLYKSIRSGEEALVTAADPVLVTRYVPDGPVDSVDAFLGDPAIRAINSRRILIPYRGLTGMTPSDKSRMASTRGALHDFAFHEGEIATINGIEFRKDNLTDQRSVFNGVDYFPATGGIMGLYGEFSYGVQEPDTLLCCASMRPGIAGNYQLISINPGNGLITNTFPRAVHTLIGSPADVTEACIFKLFEVPGEYPATHMIAIGKCELISDGSSKLFACQLVKSTCAVVPDTLVFCSVATDPYNPKFEIHNAEVFGTGLYITCYGYGDDGLGGFEPMYITALYLPGATTLTATQHPLTIGTAVENRRLVRMVREGVSELVLYYRNNSKGLDDEIVRYNVTTPAAVVSTPVCDSKNSTIRGIEVDAVYGRLYVIYNGGGPGVSSTMKIKLWDLADLSVALGEQIFEIGPGWGPTAIVRLFSDGLLYILFMNYVNSGPVQTYRVAVFKIMERSATAPEATYEIREIDRRDVVTDHTNAALSEDSFIFDELDNARFCAMGTLEYDNGLGLTYERLILTYERLWAMPRYSFEESVEGRLYIDKRASHLQLKQRGAFLHYPIGAKGSGATPSFIGAVQERHCVLTFPTTLAYIGAVLPVGAIVLDVHLAVLVPMDGIPGTGGAVTVGDTIISDRLVASGEIDPTLTNDFLHAPSYVPYAGGEQLTATAVWNTNASAGSFGVVVKFIEGD